MKCWNRKRKPKHSTKTKYRTLFFGDDYYFCKHSYVKSKSDTSPKLGFTKVHRKWKLGRLIFIINVKGKIKTYYSINKYSNKYRKVENL